jgi:Tol biopolymer transport system component/predicted Ser/Thr protein kinase
MTEDGGTEIRGKRNPASAGFEIGSQVGSYRIDARLGEGGMGVVYRATDTKLNREVAIKVLGDHLFDANARRRFQREAQMASGLNHPHIVTVYDIGEHADRQYLVTELVDGGTLQDWAHTEPHRWRPIVELMLGVADALAAAHDASILHRDVKPANILITKSGYAKLADFGLAKLVEDDDAARARGTRQTVTGAVVGTAAYMSPEQALGRKLDARSDIFTFGVVLYELLAGRHPFAGESDVVMLQAVIHAQPPPLPDEIPEALRTIVDKALEKEPSDRYQSMRELVVDLRRVARKSGTDRVPIAPQTARRWRAWIPWLAVSLTGLALVAALVARRGAGAGPAEAAEFVILPPDGTGFLGNRFISNSAVSPDGRQVAFVAAGTDGASRIWIRPFATVTAKPLADTEGASGPFWSPDGRSLGFFARGQLRRIDVSGGTALALADAGFPLGGAWSPSGVIVYAPQLGSPLLSVPASGGKSTPVTRLQPSAIGHFWPSFLPDGRHFVFATSTGPPGADATIGSLDSTEVQSLLAGTSYVRYAEPGYLLFTRGRTLLAQRLDAARLTISGDPTPIAENVATPGELTARSGVLIYQPGGETRSQLLWTDRSGRPTGIAAPAGEYTNVALSPDGTRVAFDRTTGSGQEVWILDLQRTTTSRLTFSTSFANVPIWSPDGRYVAFASERSGLDIYRHAANLTGTDDLVLELHAPPIMFPSDWSADGKYLTYYRTSTGGKIVEWVLPIGGGDPIELPHEAYDQSQGQFSPDGKWLAYVSTESGAPQIYVQSFPERGGKWQVSAAGGTQPRWARDGKELYFLAPDRRLMAVAVAASDGFEVRGIEPLFATTLDVGAPRQMYAVAADGRFLLNAPVATSSAPLVVVLNWTTRLKK